MEKLSVSIILLVFVTLTSCGNDNSETVNSMSDSSTESVSDGPIILKTNITQWSDERLEFEYTLTNETTSGLTIFNEPALSAIFNSTENSAANILVEENGPVLFTGAVSLDQCLNPERPITVGAEELASASMLTGLVSQPLPLGSMCTQIPEPDNNPASLTYCVGYLPDNDDKLAIALAEGELQSGQSGQYIISSAQLQRVCVTLSR